MKQPEYITLYLGNVPIMRLSTEQLAALHPDVRIAIYRAAGMEPSLEDLFERHKFASLDLAEEATKGCPHLQMTHAYRLYERRN